MMRRLQWFAKFAPASPHIRTRIVVTGTPWPNPVVYSFHRMAEAAAHEILVTTDSDVEVDPLYLREIVPPLLDPQVGMGDVRISRQECGGIFSGLTPSAMSVEMTAGGAGGESARRHEVSD